MRNPMDRFCFLMQSYPKQVDSSRQCTEHAVEFWEEKE